MADIKEFATSTKTRMMYSLMSLGVATPAEAVAGIIAFYIVDVKNLPATWYATFWFFYTIYNALNNPAAGFHVRPNSLSLGKAHPVHPVWRLALCCIFCPALHRTLRRQG